MPGLIGEEPGVDEADGDQPGRATAAAPAPDAAPAARPAGRGKRIASDKVQITAYIPRDVAEAARDAVIATTPYRNGYRGLSDLIADAVGEKVQRLSRQFNGSRPFPPRDVELRRGRRVE
jgi:hypothetical protein